MEVRDIFLKVYLFLDCQSRKMPALGCALFCLRSRSSVKSSTLLEHDCDPAGIGSDYCRHTIAPISCRILGNRSYHDSAVSHFSDDYEYLQYVDRLLSLFLRYSDTDCAIFACASLSSKDFQIRDQIYFFQSTGMFALYGIDVGGLDE